MLTKDDIQGFLMLMRPKKAYWVPQKELDLESGASQGKTLDQNFDDLVKSHND